MKLYIGGATQMKKEPMKEKSKLTRKEVIPAIITGFIGLVATIIATLISNKVGQISTAVYYNDDLITSEEFQQIINEKNDLEKQGIILSSEVDRYKEQIQSLNLEITSLKYENTNLQQDLKTKPAVEYSTLQLVLNGIESGYSDKVVTINNDIFYSIGFLNYLIDNQSVFIDAGKLFIGSVKSEESMPTALMDLQPFQTNNIEIVTNFEDNYENRYEYGLKIKAYRDTIDIKPEQHAQEYYINNQYKKFAFDIVYAKDANKYNYEFILYGDNKHLKTVHIDRKSKVEHIEIELSNVEFLQILGIAIDGGGYYTDYFYIVNPYLYP